MHKVHDVVVLLSKKDSVEYLYKLTEKAYIASINYGLISGNLDEHNTFDSKYSIFSIIREFFESLPDQNAFLVDILAMTCVKNQGVFRSAIEKAVELNVIPNKMPPDDALDKWIAIENVIDAFIVSVLKATR